MILREVQDYLSQQGKASLAQMELHFRIDADALRGMLQQLVRKGRVRKLPIPPCCQGCVSCRPEQLEFYEWFATESIRSTNQTCANKSS
ncbi:FeoC-like transcriptional regulator [Chroococcidiopsis sp. TS-821]|uniref:FeoC-like transcriptional regulator n=1 Tax=Chroococcidiopsis sp. TS-821 TaxID=1378066 RepID=UPI000CEE7937|nr:FeoC-like transcriptional regulator [Chroococcidiopsis sp. TS-821]PPS45024.1 sugar metabolism transcriptional regulator [Chroococcidiopsis sp. TS-821]